MSNQNHSVYEDARFDPKAQGESSAYDNKHYTFKEGLKIRLPNKGDNEKTFLHIMPAFANYQDPVSWQQYRDSNPPPGRTPDCFTPWCRAYDVWEWVGGTTHILDYSSIDPSCTVNPVKTLWDTMSAMPDMCVLLGKTPDGKKNQAPEAFKHTKFRMKSKRYVFNAVNRSRVTEGEADMACLYSVPRTAVAGGGKDAAGWGLFAALDTLQRNVPEGTPMNDYAKRFYWGDITDPRANYPVVIYKAPPPSGGMKLYNMVPAPNAQPVAVPQIDGSFPWLATRTPLRASDLFVDYDPGEVTEILIALFSDKAPKALIRAFETTQPGIRDRILKVTGIISESRLHQAGIGAGTTAPQHGSMMDDDLPGLPSPGGSFPPPPPAGAFPPPPAMEPAHSFAPPATMAMPQSEPSPHGFGAPPPPLSQPAMAAAPTGNPALSPEALKAQLTAAGNGSSGIPGPGV